jgi:hypothetical protein
MPSGMRITPVLIAGKHEMYCPTNSRPELHHHHVATHKDHGSVDSRRNGFTKQHKCCA